MSSLCNSATINFMLHLWRCDVVPNILFPFLISLWFLFINCTRSFSEYFFLSWFLKNFWRLLRWTITITILYCSSNLSGLVRLKEECFVPCWNDCVLTEWSPWSACFKSSCTPPESVYRASEGQQLRTRQILQEPIDGGVQCSTNLEERRACGNGTCFTFKWRTYNK